MIFPILRSLKLYLLALLGAIVHAYQNKSSPVNSNVKAFLMQHFKLLPALVNNLNRI